MMETVQMIIRMNASNPEIMLIAIMRLGQSLSASVLMTFSVIQLHIICTKKQLCLTKDKEIELT